MPAPEAPTSGEGCPLETRPPELAEFASLQKRLEDYRNIRHHPPH